VKGRRGSTGAPRHHQVRGEVTVAVTVAVMAMAAAEVMVVLGRVGRAVSPAAMAGTASRS
jgi:hypothetical protein